MFCLFFLTQNSNRPNGKPKFSSFFNYKIASIASESNIKKKTGLNAIQEFIENYDKESGIDLETAKELKLKLK